ncbi:MAG: CoA pyrophosphatase [Rhodospirillales bacterium]|nr:CoA pyrophosphatase [Rhodospirillales bacterium]
MEQRQILSHGQAGRPDRVTPEVIAERLTRLGGGRRSDAATARLLGGEDVPSRAPDRLLVPAAVLVPLVERASGLMVLLTRRTAHLANHAGQISFPGGRIEDQDQGDPIRAALRETQEEVGLASGHIRLLGRLDEYVTVTGFSVSPVVAAVRPPFDLKPDPFEVAEVFEVPLTFILDPANHRRHSRMVDGRERFYYAMPYGEHYIWGATAGMLINLYEALQPCESF